MSDRPRRPGVFDHHGSWQTRAACRHADSRLFFHPNGERGQAHEDRDREAKRVCAHCPVSRACLEYALLAEEVYGIWGGLTEAERAELVRPSRRRTARRTATHDRASSRGSHDAA
ncbi:MULTISPECIES: WhiB family transcriptional regulator [unclassified Streptomyces]|uniref:WhiB family transcriptional regulator n=1 Tax=Streptomycetaceae TaxID=2062 RepID=UPI002E76241D|nr:MULTISPECIES: WhiB family transcriptional regulator [unclassified Streptomyces]MED7952903.1 WhiB family transcriptional regulator [Streptomyces sp. BE303]MEE1825142.1 WhiB family transcriptional regulator [Streptomyces sp. BE20]